MTEDWKKTIRELLRVLKHGGELFFVEMLDGITKNPFLVKIFHYTGGGEFSAKELADYLSDGGFKITGLKKIGNLFALGVARKKEGK